MATIADRYCEAAADAARLDALRLAAVRGTGLLDSAPEPELDRITRLGATLLSAPACFLSIVDVARDFYKSHYGFTGWIAETRELTGRTFCHFTLANRQPLVIGDTLADPTFAAVPTVETLGVRSYIGIPLRVEGQIIGGLCAIDVKPRDWRELEVEVMLQLAAAIERELRLRAALVGARRADATLHEQRSAMAKLAHDLRAPLQSLALGTALLEQGVSRDDGTGRRMHNAIASMRHMIDEMLSVSTGAGAAVRQAHTVSAHELLQSVVSSMQGIACSAGIDLVFDARDCADGGGSGASVRGESARELVTVDREQLLRALNNLVNNAVKYCPAGSRVVLASRRTADAVTLWVRDNGPGMSDEERAHAFEPGYRGKHSGRAPDGTGLGLSIVRELVEQNGGTVHIERSAGDGTCVTLRFPAVDATTAVVGR